MENYMTFKIDDAYSSINDIRKFLDNAALFISDDTCIIEASLKFTTKVYPTKITCGSCYSNSSSEDLLIQTHKCSYDSNSNMEGKEMKKAIIITTEGGIEEFETDADFESIKAVVGWWIEHVTLAKDNVPIGSMYVNEKGKDLDLPINKIATELFLQGRKYHDFIVGNAIIFGLPNEDGFDTSVTQEIIDLINIAKQRS